MTDLERIKLFNGEPSFRLKKRPFYSIVIACYESEYLSDLLESIKQQHMKEDIEVILSDDCSPNQNYLEQVIPYLNDISIKCVQTDYNCCPGNTRERGSQYAEGEWLVFADHDDEFIADTLSGIKEQIIQSGEKYLCVANFYHRNCTDHHILEKMVRTRNWCHAKFFNIDNLWKPFDVHFKKDLMSHEDIYITTYTSCCLYNIKGKDEVFFLDTFCYYWNYHQESLSNRPYGDRTFIEVFLKDYLISTGYTYLETYYKRLISPLFAYENCAATMLYLYFYIVNMMMNRPQDYLTKNIGYARKFLIKIKQNFKIEGRYVTNQDLVKLTTDYNNLMYLNIRERAFGNTGKYEPFISFKDWLNLLDEDKE